MDAPDSCSAQAPEHRASAQDKRELLRKFLSAGENLQDLEAHFTAERSVEDQTEEVTGHDRPADARGRVLRAPWPDIHWHSMHIIVSIRDRALALTQLRAKIAAVTAKGGLPDADAPNDYESMRFWCTKKLVKTARDTSTVKASVTARVQGALCALLLGEQVHGGSA